MLKVEYGMIGNNGFVNLSLDDSDISLVKNLVNGYMEVFHATNGCAINLVDVLDGKTCVPCPNEEVFKMVEFAINEFNEKYIHVNEEEKEEVKDNEKEKSNESEELDENEFKELLNHMFIEELKKRLFCLGDDDEKEDDNNILVEKINELIDENNELRQDLLKVLLENKILKFLLSKTLK